LWCNG